MVEVDCSLRPKRSFGPQSQTYADKTADTEQGCSGCAGEFRPRFSKAWHFSKATQNESKENKKAKRSDNTQGEQFGSNYDSSRGLTDVPHAAIGFRISAVDLLSIFERLYVAPHDTKACEI